jgi:hypothetical protein
MLLTSGAFAHDPAAAVVVPSEFERQALKADTQVVWSDEVAKLVGGETRLTISGYEYKAASAPNEIMRGLRIDIADGAAQDTVFIEDVHARKVRALVQQLREDVDREGLRNDVSAQCRGVYEFYSAEPLYHSLTAEFCKRAGFTGLRLTTLKKHGYELPDADAAALVTILDRALGALEKRASRAL